MQRNIDCCRPENVWEHTSRDLTDMSNKKVYYVNIFPVLLFFIINIYLLN